MKWLLCLLCVSFLSAQAEAPLVALRQAAEAAWQARDYEKVVVTATALTEAAPEDAAAWHHLGYALHTLGRLEQAIVAHERCAALYERDARSARLGAYNLACAHALRGNRDEAIRWLGIAIDRGLTQRRYLEHDEDLASLRQDPRFTAQLARLPQRLKVAVVVYEGVELLDFAGPAEVFSSASTADDEPLFEVVLVAPAAGPVKTNNGAILLPQYTIVDAPACEVLVIPGGGSGRMTNDPAFLQWAKRRIETSRVTLSVCSGVFVLAKLGLLDGKEATTHHGARERLRERHPAVKVVEAKVVDLGQLVTAAGVSSGIEGALHVVQRLCGSDVARGVADYMEYRWQPTSPGQGR